MKKHLSKILAVALCLSTSYTMGFAHVHNHITHQETINKEKESNVKENQVATGESGIAKGDAKKQAILVMSTGTTYNAIREVTIDAIEKMIKEQFKTYEVYSVFSSQSIIKKIEARDHIDVLDVEEAMRQLIENKVGTVVIQPTYVMNGLEYENMKAVIEQYKDHFVNIVYGTPLLSSTEDYKEVAKVMQSEAANLKTDEALVYMGHGTTHFANATYPALNYVLNDLGYHNIVVGTLESYPALDEVIKTLKTKNIKKVKLMPFMVLAGTHANTDMAGKDKDSWKTQLEAAGFEVECVVKGLSEYEAIQKLYTQHAQTAIATLVK